MDYYIHPSSYVDVPSTIGGGTTIWHFCHIMQDSRIGSNCTLGQNVYVGNNAIIGNYVKIQNNVSIYSGVELEDYVFCGPSCVFTNIINPRSEVIRKNEFKKTIVKRGATIGANATILCGITIGRYAFVAAGAVLLESIPDYSLVVGTPAKHIGWMSRHGYQLFPPDQNGIMRCPTSGWRYQTNPEGQVVCLDFSEEDTLPN